jgi:copper transport protein
MAVLVISGLLQGIRQIQTWDGLWHTSYSRLLLTKVLVVIGIVIVASAARDAVRHRATTGTDGDDAALLRDLRRSVGLEAGLAVLVVAITTALVVSPPAREAVAATRHPTAATLALTATSHNTHYAIQVQPALPGDNTIVLSPNRLGDGFLPVTMTGTVDGARGLPPTRLTFVALEDGRWVTTAMLPSASSWTVHLDGDTVTNHDTTSFHIKIR